MNTGDLNETCPFGHRSTNYLSKQGMAPNLKDAQMANKLISSTLEAFVKFLDQQAKTHSPAPTGIYEEWGGKCVQISETVPRSLMAVVPIRLARSAEVAIDELRASEFQSIQTILRLHDEVLADERSHMKAAQRVMSLLKRSCFSVFCNDPVLDILAFEQGSQEDSLLIPDALWHAAVAYQDLQERVDSVEEVRRLNSLVKLRPEILEGILGIQVRLCEMLELFLQENPDFKGGRIAFSEVALWNEELGEMIPSTRLLKILIHNWGRYFLERPNSSLNAMLRHAVCRALEDEIYRQDIFIFRRGEDGMRLFGVASKVCPARTAVGKMMLHYLSE